MQSIITPSQRLLATVPYLKRGGRVIDVGTDHAYLPIYLIKEDISVRALACDINQGPIESAKENILRAGLEERISTLKTDGLHGTSEFCPDDILICGMGGELILRILSEAPWIKTERIGLVLQPMSRAHLLRAWLLENGFSITGETLVLEEKYYQVLAARYTGKGERYTEEELYLGKHHLENPSPLLGGFIEHRIGVYEAILKGKSKSNGQDTQEEERILGFLKERLEKIK